MNEDLRLGRVFVGIAVVIIASLLAVAAIIDSYGCHARFEGSGLQSDWGVMSGCRVNVPGQGWIPAQNYRVL